MLTCNNTVMSGMICLIFSSSENHECFVMVATTPMPASTAWRSIWGPFLAKKRIM